MGHRSVEHEQSRFQFRIPRSQTDRFRSGIFPLLVLYIEQWFSRQEREVKPFSSLMTPALVSREYVVNLSLKNTIAGAVEAKLAKLRKRKRQRED